MNKIQQKPSSKTVQNGSHETLDTFTENGVPVEEIELESCQNPNCENFLIGKRKDAKYCSDICRLAAWHKREDERKERIRKATESTRRTETKKFIEKHPEWWDAFKDNVFNDWIANIEDDRAERPISIRKNIEIIRSELGYGPDNSLQKYLREELEAALPILKNAFRVRGHRATK